MYVFNCSNRAKKLILMKVSYEEAKFKNDLFSLGRKTDVNISSFFWKFFDISQKNIFIENKKKLSQSCPTMGV